MTASPPARRPAPAQADLGLEGEGDVWRLRSGAVVRPKEWEAQVPAAAGRARRAGRAGGGGRLGGARGCYFVGGNHRECAEKGGGDDTSHLCVVGMLHKWRVRPEVRGGR